MQVAKTHSSQRQSNNYGIFSANENWRDQVGLTPGQKAHQVNFETMAMRRRDMADLQSVGQIALQPISGETAVSGPGIYPACNFQILSLLPTRKKRKDRQGRLMPATRLHLTSGSFDGGSDPAFSRKEGDGRCVQCDLDRNPTQVGPLMSAEAYRPVSIGSQIEAAMGAAAGHPLVNHGPAGYLQVCRWPAEGEVRFIELVVTDRRRRVVLYRFAPADYDEGFGVTPPAERQIKPGEVIGVLTAACEYGKAVLNDRQENKSWKGDNPRDRRALRDTLWVPDRGQGRGEFTLRFGSVMLRNALSTITGGKGASPVVSLDRAFPHYLAQLPGTPADIVRKNLFDPSRVEEAMLRMLGTSAQDPDEFPLLPPSLDDKLDDALFRKAFDELGLPLSYSVLRSTPWRQVMKDHGWSYSSRADILNWLGEALGDRNISASMMPYAYGLKPEDCVLRMKATLPPGKQYRVQERLAGDGITAQLVMTDGTRMTIPASAVVMDDILNGTLPIENGQPFAYFVPPGAEYENLSEAERYIGSVQPLLVAFFEAVSEVRAGKLGAVSLVPTQYLSQDGMAAVERWHVDLRLVDKLATFDSGGVIFPLFQREYDEFAWHVHGMDYDLSPEADILSSGEIAAKKAEDLVEV